MSVIYKYGVSVADEFTLRMPKGARILSLQVQHCEPHIWALVDTKAPTVNRNFSLRGTGHSCTGLELAPFVGTFQLQNGTFVFHLFDLGESEP